MVQKRFNNSKFIFFIIHKRLFFSPFLYYLINFSKKIYIPTYYYCFQNIQQTKNQYYKQNYINKLVISCKEKKILFSNYLRLF